MAALTDFEREQLATKADLYGLETRLVKWTVGMIIAVVLAMLGNLGALVILILRLSEN